MLRYIGVAGTLFTMISSVSAHEGHGHPEHQSGILHYAVNPSHAIPVLIVCAVGLTAAYLVRRIRRVHAEKQK